jgi:transposase
LEADLLAAGERLSRVPTKLMAESRKSGREPGKSDPIDALAVARAAWREPDLPAAGLDGPHRQLRLLVDHRDGLVEERTRLQNRIRWALLEIDPELQIRPRGLRCRRIVDEVEKRLSEREGLLVELTLELLDRVRELNHRAVELQRQIATLVERLAPALLTIPGCAALTAAKVIGETAGAGRFSSKAAYARWNGTAPIPVWTGNKTQFRINRGGNRQVNAALYRIAITQARLPGPGQNYLRHCTAAGKTKRAALRLLRRRLSDVVFRALRQDEIDSPTNHVSVRTIICNAPI